MRYLISIKGFCVPNLRLVNVLILNIFIYNSTVPAENLELLHAEMEIFCQFVDSSSSMSIVVT